MHKASDNLFSAGKLFAIVLAAVLATGCISAKSPPTEEAAAAEPAAPVEEAAAAAAPAAAAMSEDLTSSGRPRTRAASDQLWVRQSTTPQRCGARNLNTAVAFFAGRTPVCWLSLEPNPTNVMTW